jgi:hypothetical protein
VAGLHKPRPEGEQSRDLSPAAVSRAVLAVTAQKPYVLYPAAVGILGTAASLLLGASPLFVVPAVIGGAVGLGSWAVDYFLRRDHHASAYLRELQRSLSDRRARAARALETELREADFPEGLAQLERLEDKYRTFKELLDKKLDRNEITYGRYLGMAEQVFLSALDNLQRAVHTLGSVRAIDDDYVAGRIRTLERRHGPTPAERAERESLRQRLALKVQQQEQLGQWLAQNERAMTQLDLTLAAIAAMRTVRGHATTDLETAMAELAKLAGRASDYALQDDHGHHVTGDGR